MVPAPGGLQCQHRTKQETLGEGAGGEQGERKKGDGGVGGQ